MPILPDWGYGLFFLDCFDFGVVLTWLRFVVASRTPSFDDTDLKLASFFIRLEKGRRRLERSDDDRLALSNWLDDGRGRVLYETPLRRV
jgi:hypothetical protein